MKLFDNRMKALTVLLLLQGAAYYAVAFHPETTPPAKPLSSFPTQVGGWRMQQDIPLEKEVQDVLRADDTLSRIYSDPSGRQAVNLFIAFFKTQRYGQAPHSPKNCLPGSGWEPVDTGTIAISIPGQSEPIQSNKYVVVRGSQKSAVLYWYQSHGRVIPTEYLAKFWLVADSIRYRRSDTSLVRFVAPVEGDNAAAAMDRAVQFIQVAFPVIALQLPQ